MICSFDRSIESINRPHCLNPCTFLPDRQGRLVLAKGGTPARLNRRTANQPWPLYSLQERIIASVCSRRKPTTGRAAWPPAAYNPITGLLYIPANDHLCGTSVGEEVEYRPGRAFTGADAELTLGADTRTIGELQAWDMDTGEEVWTHRFPSNNWGPVLTTGGGLVFMGGTSDRYFRAFDARTGEVLWKQRTNSGIIGVPSTYEIDGVQYVAVQSGWGVDARSQAGRIAELRGNDHFVPEGGVVWVFALRDRSD